MLEEPSHMRVGWTFMVWSDWLPVSYLWLPHYQDVDLGLVNETSFSIIQHQKQHMISPLSPPLVASKTEHFLLFDHNAKILLQYADRPVGLEMELSNSGPALFKELGDKTRMFSDINTGSCTFCIPLIKVTWYYFNPLTVGSCSMFAEDLHYLWHMLNLQCSDIWNI